MGVAFVFPHNHELLFTPNFHGRGQVSTWGTIMCVCNPKIDADVSNPLTPLGAMCDTPDAKKYGEPSSHLSPS